MAVDPKTYVASYLRAVDSFNDGDVLGFGALIADECTFDGTAGHFGTGSDEIVKALQAGRDAGWVSHNPIGTVAAGEFLVAVYENRYADGSSVIGAGTMRFGTEGKLTEMRSLDPR